MEALEFSSRAGKGVEEGRELIRWQKDPRRKTGGRTKPPGTEDSYDSSCKGDDLEEDDYECEAAVVRLARHAFALRDDAREDR